MRNTNNQTKKRLYLNVKKIIKRKNWRIKHLRAITDTSFEYYKRAIELSLSNDLMTEFNDNFHDFKSIYREKYMPIKNLIGLRDRFLYEKTMQ